MNRLPRLTDFGASSFRSMAGWTLALILVVLFIPWLGESLFNTKGEPREALVALSMIQSGDWILPTVYGGDIPYKPPFLAWLIAAASVFTGGVTEFSSRLPSAVATVLLLLYFYRTLLRHCRSLTLALVATLVTATTTEVFRAAGVCRVDMVLTACLVGALLSFFNARERHGRPVVCWIAILLMSGAVLTKGPVGMALPCLVAGIYYLLRGDKPWRAIWTLCICGLCSLLLPLAWYYAAYLEGGDEFLSLVSEENLGRLTGTMSYDSHLNPWWYNVITLLAGMLPYTLLALLSVFCVGKLQVRGTRPVHFLRSLRPFTLLALTASVTIFIFYCIPASKRSVYLLPMYPFLGYLVARLWLWLALGRRWPVKVYGAIIASVALLAGWTVWGLHMVETKPGMVIFNSQWGIVDWALAILVIVAGAWGLLTVKRGDLETVASTLMATICILLFASATVIPAFLNPKSDLQAVEAFDRLGVQYPVYTYNDHHLMRWYSASFYTGDRLRRIDTEQPDSGLLLVAERDTAAWSRAMGNRYAVEDTLWRGDYKSGDTRSRPLLLRVRRR